MKYLFIDASNMNDTVAQIGNEKDFVNKVFKTNRDFAAKITSICDEMLKIKNYKISDIDTFVLGTGPGSLTGLRVAAAFMRAMSMLKHCKLLGVNQFIWASNTLKQEGINHNINLVMPTLIDKAFLVKANLESLKIEEPALIERTEIPHNDIPTYGINIEDDYVKKVLLTDVALHDLIVNKQIELPAANGMPEILNILPMYVIPSQAERKFKFNGGDNK